MNAADFCYHIEDLVTYTEAQAACFALAFVELDFFDNANETPFGYRWIFYILLLKRT